MRSTSNGKALYEDLDTAFVNLWSLLRNLTQRGFVGRVHIEFANYYADVFLTGSGTPLVHEVDSSAGTDTLEEAALHRLVLRARETPGKISVFEGVNEAISVESEPFSSKARAESFDSRSMRSTYIEPEPPRPNASAGTPQANEIRSRDVVIRNLAEQIDSKPAAGDQSSMTISLGAELIAAVERAVSAMGEDFTAVFDSVRLELADDFSYLDPMSNALKYSNGAVSLARDVPEAVYVSGVSEALRRTVERVATGDRARRVRERIALELLGVARKRKEALEQSKFGLQLDRIAGTKVI